MKKSLIALAALAAVSAASAQSTVTVSGGLVLAVGTSTLDSQSSKTEIRRQTGNLAFKGSEDLGGGLKANFEVQTSIGADADTANGANPTVLGDRGLYINLTGAFGAVQAGKAATATRAIFGAMGDVSRLAVPSGLSAGSSSAASSVLGQPGDTGSFVTANNATAVNPSTASTPVYATNPSYLAGTGVLDAGDARARVIYGDTYAKYVAYQTPTISGFTGSIGIVPTRSNDADTFNNAPQKSFGVTYANGPLGVAYNLVDAPAATGGTGTVTGAYKQNTIVASYDFGVVKVGVTSQMIKLASGVNPSNGLSLTANAPITGAGSIGFGYGKRGASTSADTRFGDDVKQTFIGYRHEFSKRTNVQFVMNKIDRQGSTTTNDLAETHVLLGHSF
jgi:hypothetical protein